MNLFYKLNAVILFVFLLDLVKSDNKTLPSSSVSASLSIDQNLEQLPQDKYLNNLINDSNILPELIEYYDLVDDVSSSPDVYPDPDEMKRQSQINSNVIDDKKNATVNRLTKTSTRISIKTIFNNHNNNNNTVTTINDLNLTNGNGRRLNDNSDSMNSIARSGTKRQQTFHLGDDIHNEDLREHDLIDNIMYIYYGSNVALRKSLGSNIIIVGTVFALAAQILAVIFTLLRNRQLKCVNCLSTISLNLLLTLCASNLVFIVGVQASKNIFKCEVIAMLLHYFHLSTAIWGLNHTFAIYDYVINDNIPILKYNNLLAYGGSAVLVLFSFAISSSSYEIYDYCWMSVQRGMIINYMIPTSLLIIATTAFGTLTLRSVVSRQRQVIVDSIENILEKCQHIDTLNANIITMDSNFSPEYSTTFKCCEEMDKPYTETELKSIDFYDSKFDLGALSIADISLQSSSDAQDFSEFKNAVKFSLFFQPAFSVCWFLGVVALENRQSCVMPVIFMISYNILNWYILYRFPNISPLITPPPISNNLKEKYSNKDINHLDSSYSISDDVNHQPSCTDTIPLLCSVTGNNGINVVDSNTILSSNTVSASHQLSIEDIICKSSMSQWDASMENINLDCMSTVSN